MFHPLADEALDTFDYDFQRDIDLYAEAVRETFLPFAHRY